MVGDRDEVYRGGAGMPDNFGGIVAFGVDMEINLVPPISHRTVSREMLEDL